MKVYVRSEVVDNIRNSFLLLCENTRTQEDKRGECTVYCNGVYGYYLRNVSNQLAAVIVEQFE